MVRVRVRVRERIRVRVSNSGGAKNRSVVQKPRRPTVINT